MYRSQMSTHLSPRNALCLLEDYPGDSLMAEGCGEGALVRVVGFSVAREKVTHSVLVGRAAVGACEKW